MEDKLTSTARFFHESFKNEIEKAFDVKYHDVLNLMMITSFKAGAVYGANDMKDLIFDNNRVLVPIERYVDKLVNSWKKHGKIIICVDYDDTLVGYDTNNEGICNEVCKLVAEAQEIGANVILWTCRNPDNILNELVSIHKTYNINFNELNPIIPFKKDYSHKPYCNIMLDDKSGLEQSIEILRSAVAKMKNYERTTTESDESPENDRRHDVQ